MINILAGSVVLSIPMKYRNLIGDNCEGQGSIVKQTYWRSKVEANLWLQLDGVVVESR